MLFPSLESLVKRSPAAWALLVTLLWSSSYVMIKWGLHETTPLLFASLRYLLASVILLSLAAGTRSLRLSGISKRDWFMFGMLGLSGYTIAQGLQFVGLAHITAISTTFVLNFTPIIVALLSWTMVREAPNYRQWFGVAVALAGAYFFFGRFPEGGEATGLIVVALSSFAWAFYLVLVRRVSRKPSVSGLALTALSMTIGAVFLFGFALAAEGWTTPSMNLAWLIGWLAVVNTSVAFLIWNTVLRYMRAFELSMLQNTMLIQIPILALIFLTESITAGMLIGMAAVFIGVILVQLRRNTS